MSDGIELTHELPDNRRLVTQNARFDKGAFVADVAVYNARGEREYANLVTLNHQPSIVSYVSGMRTDCPNNRALLACIGLITSTLTDWGSDPATTIAAAIDPQPRPAEFDLRLAGDTVLEVRQGKILSNGRLAAFVTQRADNGQFLASDEVTFDDGAGENRARQRFVLTGEAMFAIKERLQEMLGVTRTGTMSPANPIIRAGDLQLRAYP